MQKFIVAGTQRTGTSLIESTLNSHPDIRCLSEVFIFKKGRGKSMTGSYRQYINQRRRIRTLAHYINRRRLITDYLDQLFNSYDGKAMGFKFMLSQARQFPAATRYLQENKVVILHVVRENALKTLISRISARTNKLYHSVGEAKVNKVYIPPGSLIKELERILGETQQWQKFALDNPYVKVSYEKFITEREQAIKPALNQLGVNYLPSMSSDLKKIVPDDLGEIVQNLDEIVQRLAGTKYERFLDNT